MSIQKFPIIALVVFAAGLLLGGCGEQAGKVEKAVQLKAAEVVGNIAARNMGNDVAGGFHEIPIALRELAPNVFQATGISNAHLITTPAGSVLFDTGISIQAAKQIKLLKPKQQGPLTHIILSHSHADHIGGTKFWQEADTQILAHLEFPEEQRYLSELEPYLWQRNRTVFPWMPESPPTEGMFAYGGIEPDLLVDHRDYSFTLGGTEFQVLSTPGAEGADNLCLWLPEQKILFSGDFFGPLWPQFPNIFTMRGEKVRKPIEYIASLNKLIALEPEVIVPSHHSPIEGADNIRAGMIKMRDAVQYVHDAVIDGMNGGATVHELMAAIELPPELALTQEHGMVSWAVKSIWEYYATWFHFDSTTELYEVPVRNVYPELAGIVGNETLLAHAQAHYEAGRVLEALHFLEIALSQDPVWRPGLELRLKVLDDMLETAVSGKGNNYEKDYLRARIALTRQDLGLEG